ncbi:hypothetical protein KKA66_03285 [Patescibacteria group bacterium]|nr:hypothetical protein [Patescibacteria group bacterium]
MGFDYYDIGGEESETEYIKKFKEIYCEEMITPEGFNVFCANNDGDIKHIWRGGKKGSMEFNKGRATRIGWIKEVVENSEKRTIKQNPYNKHIYFVSKKISKGTYYVVRCRYIKSKNKLRVYTAHLVSNQQIQVYMKWNNYYFEKQKNC